ncbi:hypothetical protein CBR_g28631 [Chara braunii]|uniref:Reverse transcriptase domain-containing protein n=1 Tax=Chara braunii TaxID=69332 RepID=A0A388L9C9_CHABU|nr:hypothetical protein CBR_g28631 [Chara braunii]|eukprot:GBG78917.1 hypothetical protein CBR_g28631 [Chara braunii]
MIELRVITRAQSLRVPHVFQALDPGEERRIRRARALAAGIAEANRAAREQATAARAVAMANGASSAASSFASSSGTNGSSLGMPTSSRSCLGTSGSTGSSQSSSQMAGSQFRPRVRGSSEMLRRKLEKDLKDATDRENAMKTRAARLESLEADKAELEGLDESALTDPLKVLKKNMLSLHAHVDSKLDFMQSTLDQILDALKRPGFRPSAQSLLPLSAMSGPFPVQAGTQPSGTSAAAAQIVASSSSGPAVVATPPQQSVPAQGQQQGQWYPKTPMKLPLAFSGERKDEELNTWFRTVPVWVKSKRTLPEDEVVTAASYLEGKAAKWLDGVVIKAGYGRRMADWAKSLTLDQFVKMVEARWHNPQEAQKATDAINKLDQRNFTTIRELMTTVESLILVPDVSEALEDLESEWSNKDPRESWVALRKGPRGEHFVVEVDVGGRKCGAFIDIGSTRNYISRDCLDRLHLQDLVRHLSRPVASTLANKEHMIETDYIKDVVCTFSYGGGELNHKISFLVSDDLPFDMLLGMYYLEVAEPQFNWDKKVLKYKLPDGRTVRMTKFKASSIVDTYGGLCTSAFYNYYKQNQEEGMYLVYVSEKGEAVKTPPEIESVVAKFPDLFEEPSGVVDREVVHAIEIIPGSKTPKGRIYRMAPAELDELRKQLKELTKKGWIRPSTSPYGSPVLFAPKKGGTLRMCINYRDLNAITVKNAEPLPCIDDLLDRVQGCKYYTKLDLKSGYHQIAIRPEDQHKTTFQTRYGLYEFVVMPFGLCNAPGTFQHAMNRIFHDHLDKFVVVYLDDILIFSKSAQEHAKHVETVLSLLGQHKYKVNLEKCEFGRTKILYLGHEVSAEGIRPEDAKVASIRDWPRPQTVTEVRSFLGMCGSYRNFVKNYSTVASPLTDLTRLDTPWDWSDECEGAFKRLKHALMNHEVLMVPDPQKPFIVTTDASQYGIGAVLAQQDGKKLRPIEYMSKKMPSKKVAKSTYERELYALYKALVHWRQFLLGRMLDDAKKYVETCEVCQQDKPRTQAPLGLLKPLPSPDGPGPSVSMDFMDTLVTSKSGLQCDIAFWIFVLRTYSCSLHMAIAKASVALKVEVDVTNDEGKPLFQVLYDKAPAREEKAEEETLKTAVADHEVVFKTVPSLPGAEVKKDLVTYERALIDCHLLIDFPGQIYKLLTRSSDQSPAPDASSSNTSDHLEALEIDVDSLKDGVQLQQTAKQQLEQRICTVANHSSSEPRETAQKYDGQEIFCDSTKTNSIPWFRKFELTLQLHYVKEHKHHAYLYSRSGAACQAWLDNLLSKYGVVAANLHTKISWDDLKAAWHKWSVVDPPEIKAMDKLMVFEQGTLSSADWIAKYQCLTSVPDIQMGFKAIRHYFISRSCPTFHNSLTHVEDTLTTTAELFDKATQIMVTNKEAKNLCLSAAGPSRDQHRPKMAVVVAATPNDQTNETLRSPKRA